MRSKIGTQSRLAAHILALFLLILMLVYLAPPQAAINARRSSARAAAAAAMPAPPTPEEPEKQAAPTPPPATEVTEQPAMPEAPAKPATETPVQPTEPEKEPSAVAEPVEAPVEPAAAATEKTEEPESVPAAPAPVISEPEPAPEPAAPATEEEQPAAAQPDESGSLVVAPSDSGGAQRVVAPLANANLEVLGDGVYWLDPRHDLEKELAAIPEIADLIVLAPLPGYTVHGFDHVKTEVIPADPADLTRDAAEQFIHLVSSGPGPVVAAALPGARGAAFFKGAYLLRSRNLSGEDVLKEIGPELEEAGSAREEIVHRLLRLAGGTD